MGLGSWDSRLSLKPFPNYNVESGVPQCPLQSLVVHFASKIYLRARHKKLSADVLAGSGSILRSTRRPDDGVNLPGVTRPGVTTPWWPVVTGLVILRPGETSWSTRYLLILSFSLDFISNQVVFASCVALQRNMSDTAQQFFCCSRVCKLMGIFLINS